LIDNASIDVGKKGAGDVFIRSGYFELNDSNILANTAELQEGGVVAIYVQDLQLLNNAEIDSRTFGPGKGGDIRIDVANDAILIDSQVFTTTSQGIDPDFKMGDAGHIMLTAKQIKLTNSEINTTTYGTGQGGNIDIIANQQLTLNSNDDNVTSIAASAKGQENIAGHAGRINITAHDVTLQGKNTIIDNNTLGMGQGGSIILDIGHQLQLTQEAKISADSKGTGTAGNIFVNTAHLSLDQSRISTAADNADGGNIIINTHQKLDMNQSAISATVNGGHGNGGNVIIGNPRLFCLVDSQVIANADSGHGGLVLIVRGVEIENQNSIITASSRTGIDGEVKIDMPNVDMNTLPISFLDATTLIKERCAARSGDNVSSFIVVGRGGLASTPDDLQSYFPMQ